jgi:hypothetical protein
VGNFIQTGLHSPSVSIVISVHFDEFIPVHERERRKEKKGKSERTTQREKGKRKKLRKKKGEPQEELKPGRQLRKSNAICAY